MEKIKRTLYLSSDVYSEMKNKFDSWNNDASEFINGKTKLDSADDLQVWTALTKTSEGLQLLFGTFSITTQRPSSWRKISFWQ